MPPDRNLFGRVDVACYDIIDIRASAALDYVADDGAVGLLRQPVGSRRSLTEPPDGGYVGDNHYTCWRAHRNLCALMKPELYQRYLEHRTAGRKREANDTIRDFIASCEGADDRDAWVRMFLSSGEHGPRIRHEVYSDLVFPTLIAGYDRGDSWSIVWLARTASNLYAASSLHAQVGYKSERQLLKQAYAIEPTNALRQQLLNAYVAEFQYCQHEWPSGILYGTDSATEADCATLLLDIDYARGLDDGTHEAMFQEFRKRIVAHRERITGPE